MADANDNASARYPEPARPELTELVQHLNLQIINVSQTASGMRFRRFNWFKENSGTKYDRTVTIEQWPDGQWWISLDVQLAPDAPPDAIGEALRRMAATTA